MAKKPLGFDSDDESTLLTALDEITGRFDDPTAGTGVTLQSVRRHVLALREGAGAPAEFVVREGSSVLGRAPDCHIAIASADLSRRHLRLSLHDGEVTCVDLDSRHDLFVNGIKAHSAVLREGDAIKLGSVVLHYRIDRL
jgi:pSer/pThr/pTyr-binding forkhead associated (FHA) protein